MDPELADLQEAQGETLRQEFPPPCRGYLGREAEWVLSLPDICSEGLPRGSGNCTNKQLLALSSCSASCYCLQSRVLLLLLPLFPPPHCDDCDDEYWQLLARVALAVTSTGSTTATATGTVSATATANHSAMTILRLIDGACICPAPATDAADTDAGFFNLMLVTPKQ